MTIDALMAYLHTGAGASVDTRTLRAGEVFFALPGTRTHGAAYASEAIAKGAAAVVLPEGIPTNLPPEKVVFHPDPLRLLGEVAAAYRRRFSLPVIAIGGSNGKTTTKALLGHLLSAHAPTLVSPRSWNNHIGVPLTLLQLSPAHRFAVIEIGDNHPGEVRALCEMIQPTIGLLTNIGEDHLEGYGTIERNLATKWELVEYLLTQPEPVLFLNGEDPLLSAQATPPTLRRYVFGNAPGSIATGKWHPLNWTTATMTGEIWGEPYQAEVPLWGSYNRLNVLAALGIARLFDLPLSTLLQALRTFQGEAYRSQVLQKNKQVIILDAYNANPTSLAASLSALWEMLKPEDRVALVLGQMEELGDYAPEAHRRAIELLLPHASQIVGVLFIGRYWESIMKAELPFLYQLAMNVESLHGLPSWLEEAPILYLKGSRSQRLERLVK